MLDRLSNWLSKGNSVLVLAGVVVLSVVGMVGGSLFNASSVNNLTQAVGDVNQVQTQISQGQLRTSCRTAVQADYDATLSVIVLASIVDDLPPELVGNLPDQYHVDAGSLNEFAESVEELKLLSEGQICVGPNPVRADGSSPADLGQVQPK
jgi:hypothetical protein